MINVKELYLTYPVEKLFYQLIKDVIIKIDENKYPNTIFYFNNNCIFKHNTKNGFFWCSYYENFDLDWLQITDLTKDMIEKYFNLKEITPNHLRIDHEDEINIPPTLYHPPREYPTSNNECSLNLNDSFNDSEILSNIGLYVY